MSNSKKRVLLSLIINALNFVLVTMAVAFFFTGGRNSILGVKGAVCFRYFTIDSNIVSALACLALIPYELKALKTGSEIPAWAVKFKYVGTALVTLTLLVVVTYLIPVKGAAPMLSGSNLYLHAICPPLAIVSFLFLDPGSITKRDAVLSTATALIYSFVYLIMVVFIGENNGGWPDLYQFNRNNAWPLFLVGMTAFTYFISRLVVFLKSKVHVKDI